MLNKSEAIGESSFNRLFNAMLLLNAPHPIYRISLGMKARKHDDTFLFDDVEKRVREFT